MKVDWVHSDYYMSNSGSGNSFVPPGGQYTIAVPLSLATLRISASIHHDQDDGTLYATCQGDMRVYPTDISNPAYYFPDYWPYAYTNWPVLAALPAEIFGADVIASDPDYSGTGGGKFIQNAIVAKWDSDYEGGDLLIHYNIFGGPPQTMPNRRLGYYAHNGGRGLGGSVEGPPFFQPPASAIKDAWPFEVVQQECWVLLVMSPNPTPPRFHYDVNPDDGDGGWLGTGEPDVITCTGGLTSYYWEIYWKLGQYAAIPTGPYTGLPNLPPSTVDFP